MCLPRAKNAKEMHYADMYDEMNTFIGDTNEMKNERKKKKFSLSDQHLQAEQLQLVHLHDAPQLVFSSKRKRRRFAMEKEQNKHT